VDYNNEPGSPPSGAHDVSCRDESRDVCEQKTIDRGNGYSEVVEECHTETQQYCSYTVDEWTTIQTYTLDGDNLQPIYEDPGIRAVSGGQESEEFSRYILDSKTANRKHIRPIPSLSSSSSRSAVRTLKMNAVGGVVGIEP
jgi:hypothetical protein